MMAARDSVGDGSAVLAREPLAERLSRRPSLTFHDGPLTWTTASRAAMARMSAHETWLGQAASSSALMASTTSNPRREFLFGAAFFSPVIVAVSSNNTEASHPYIRRSRISIFNYISWNKMDELSAQVGRRHTCTSSHTTKRNDAYSFNMVDFQNSCGKSIYVGYVCNSR